MSAGTERMNRTELLAMVNDVLTGERDPLTSFLASYEWTEGNRRSAHDSHTYDSDCAFCAGRIPAIVDAAIDYFGRWAELVEVRSRSGG
jgi:hypothetical protein